MNSSGAGCQPARRLPIGARPAPLCSATRGLATCPTGFSWSQSAAALPGGVLQDAAPRRDRARRQPQRAGPAQGHCC